jgi:hypothetical protein
VVNKPTDAHFIIFPTTELLPREALQLHALKKRDIPTVSLHWLVRMRRFGCVTSWTHWAMDPLDPLVEDQELALQMEMHGIDDVRDGQVDFGEILNSLSRRVSRTF